MPSTQSVPLRAGVKLEDFDEDEMIENWPFRELVGSLMWLTVSTRPDISNAVRAVVRYCTAPRAIHWKAALGILEYINGTSEYGITFQRGTSSSISLEVFAGADYASKATDRRSVPGGVIMFGGASVCWFSRTQKSVTLSTSEAEYVALGDAVKELLFLRYIWRFMLPSKVRRVLRFLKIINVLYNLQKTRQRTQIRSTLTYVIIFFESLSARGTLR